MWTFGPPPPSGPQKNSKLNVRFFRNRLYILQCQRWSFPMLFIALQWYTISFLYHPLYKASFILDCTKIRECIAWSCIAMKLCMPHLTTHLLQCSMKAPSREISRFGSITFLTVLFLDVNSRENMSYLKFVNFKFHCASNHTHFFLYYGTHGKNTYSAIPGICSSRHYPTYFELCHGFQGNPGLCIYTPQKCHTLEG